MVGIKGIGVYHPQSVDIKEIEENRTQEELEKLGVSQVPIEYNLTATEMAVLASRKALKDAGIESTELDIISNTQASMHDYLFWQVSAKIQDMLGASNAYFFDLYQACSGFIMGLIVAKQFLNSDPAVKKFLLCTSEKWGPSLKTRTVGKLVFGDGGASAILEKDCQDNVLLGYSLKGVGKLNDVSRMQIGAINVPRHHSLKDDDYYYRMTNLKKAVDDMIPINIDLFFEVGMKAILNSCLTLNDVKHLILPGVGFGLFEKIATRFNIPLDNTNYSYVDKYGDRGTVDMLANYQKMIKEGVLKKGDNVLVLGQGAGATWAAIVLKV